MRKTILAFALLLGIATGQAQSPTFWSNNGALVSIKDTSYLSVIGDMYNLNQGHYNNSDSIFLTGDWINSAGNHAFDSIDKGYVYMYAADQRIKGTDITYFYNLILKNQGTKYADLDAIVDGFVDMTDREFSVDTNTIWVRNRKLDAVRRSTGFLSSLRDGGLLRYTGKDSVYLFPVGSNLVTTRYRPIEITPTSAQDNQFKVRFANVDPSVEGFDRNKRFHLVCSVNPQWYHRVYHPLGPDSAQLSVFFDPTADGTSWNDIVEWKNVPEWQSIFKDNIVSGTPFTKIYKLRQSNYRFSPFALAVTSPPFAFAGPDDSICSGATATLGVSPQGTDYFYNWTPSTGLSDSTISNPDFSMVNLSTANDLYTFQLVASHIGCTDTDHVTMTVFPKTRPIAGVDTILWEKDTIRLYAYGGVQYQWTPSYSLSDANVNNPLASPEQSTLYYLTVTDTNQCTGIDSLYIIVRNKPFSNFFIPDVITPNGDGINDYWHIRDLERYPNNSVRVINRWGDEVLNEAPYSQTWTGTFRGEPLPGATYYYVIKVKNDEGQEATFNGPITIIR